MSLLDSLQLQEPTTEVESEGIGLDQILVMSREERFDKLKITLFTAKVNLAQFLNDSDSTVDTTPILATLDLHTAKGYVQRAKTL